MVNGPAFCLRACGRHAKGPASQLGCRPLDSQDARLRTQDYSSLNLAVNASTESFGSDAETVTSRSVRTVDSPLVT